MHYSITIDILDNGYTVSVPSDKATASREDEPVPYDDQYDKKVAKTAGEVLAIVKAALANVPEAEYEEAFDEASKKEPKGK